MNNQSSNQRLGGVFIGFGVLLIVLGALFFVGQAIGFEPGRFRWPFYVIIPGLAVFGVGLAAGDPTSERITPLGAAVTMTGVILLYQNAVDHEKELGLRLGTGFPDLDWAGADDLRYAQGEEGYGRNWQAVGADRARALRGWGLFLRASGRHQRVRFRPFRVALGTGDRGDSAAGRRGLVPAEKSINGPEQLGPGCDPVGKLTNAGWRCCSKARTP
jgi:hypothetical protein